MKKLVKEIINFFCLIKKGVLLKLKSESQYKIVDFSDKDYIVSFQCSVTRAVFSKNIISAITDHDIISNIDPEQAGYLGLMIGNGLRKGDLCNGSNKIKDDLVLFRKEHDTSKTAMSFDRYGNVIFFHPKDKKRCIIKPEHLISNRELINLFHPTVICMIGIHVGSRNLIIPKKTGEITNLRLVKNNEII